jgi:diphthamide synthase (EF-2-diphthine--ammonia ligase)
VALPTSCSNEEYKARMGATLRRCKAEGVTHVVHGDIFLEDVRRYRERNLASVGLSALFPLWGEDTASLARSFVDSGYRAHVACVDTTMLDPTGVIVASPRRMRVRCNPSSWYISRLSPRMATNP